MGRVKYAARNILFGYLSNMITGVLGIALQKIFIIKLGETLLGVNSTYTSILTVLSLAEMGLGTAINFSLYAPVARQDRETIKSYMYFYKKAYRIIALVVAVVGLALIPFLKYIIKDPVGIDNQQDLINFYLIFLFNTVSSYFVAYKYSLPNAEQKNYIQSNILTITKIITVLVQMVILLMTSNFYLYLLSASAIELLQKVVANYYLNYKYPYLKDKEVRKLTKEESQDIKRKTGALVCHKVGDAARLQTDSIIISGLINVTMSGFVDNYNKVINLVANFVNVIFNSVISSLGNLIATESREKQYDMFLVYRFFASWIYGFSSVGFFILLTPFVSYLYGERFALSEAVIGAILIDYYFKGERVVLSNFKTAAGVFEQDKFLPLIQGAVNLVLSVVLVQKIGLLGIYIGTIVSGLIANIIRPVIIYQICFEKQAKSYFRDAFKYIGVSLIALFVCLFLRKIILESITLGSMILMAGTITIIYNGIFLLFFARTDEFRYIYGIFREKGINLVKKDK
ncbi:lipopolysaccharide biosynthesis protein [Eisenbergiella tayi]|uniref:lipopolysaccharide biosynthesis protein n=1 Tax=Eisenbergiella tayi TaxID=1432052 RepID=UPI000848D03B|nr:polysaccharide biosynthesis protein [Eisenbergiella tayi]ODR36043.1 polysaccharide biosynthesis protein [Eisenbergiella tayi]